MNSFSPRFFMFAGILSVVFSCTSYSREDKTKAVSTLSSAISSQYSDRPELQYVLNQFLTLSRIYRKSGSEQGIKDYLIGIAKKYNHRYSVDPIGNLSIVVSGTGEFSKQKNFIAIQGHLDMVLDVEGIKADEDQSIFFKKPLDLVVQEGLLSSRDNKTSIGADNGAGIALMIRYMTHPNLSHPPLQLFFTVDEEVGMTGAAKLAIPTGVKALINVDNGDFENPAIGCLGHSVVRATYKVKTSEAFRSSAKLARIDISGLAGGHSAGSIHLGRANVVKLTSELLERLRTNKIQVQIISLTAGVVKPSPVFNQIPSAAQIQLGVALEQWPEFIRVLNEYANEVHDSYALNKDNKEDIVFSITESETPAEKPRGIDISRLDALVHALNEIPNGVVTHNQNFTNNMDLISNLSFWGINSNADSGFDIIVGALPRAFTDQTLRDFAAKMTNDLGKVGLDEPSAIVLDEAPAWTPNPDSKLIALFKSRFEQNFPQEKYSLVQVPGGLETARFAVTRPNLPMISLGPTIKEEHTHNETFDIESEWKMIQLLDALLIDLGKSSIIQE